MAKRKRARRRPSASPAPREPDFTEIEEQFFRAGLELATATETPHDDEPPPERGWLARLLPWR